MWVRFVDPGRAGLYAEARGAKGFGLGACLHADSDEGLALFPELGGALIRDPQNREIAAFGKQIIKGARPWLLHTQNPSRRRAGVYTAKCISGYYG
jgi:hypothetical protein